MKITLLRAAVSTLGACALVTLMAPMTGAQRTAGSPKSAIMALVTQWETAYEHKDKKTLISKLMVPTEDAEALEKRFQWLRGYGPTDMPGSRHPPILFETSKGSFVPSTFAVRSISVSDSTHGTVSVEEKGTYHDEDGRWKVIRKRQIRVVKYKGAWYVADYVIPSNTEDYGFYVDDIADKMIKY